jgi:hypothetical protein
MARYTAGTTIAPQIIDKALLVLYTTHNWQRSMHMKERTHSQTKRVSSNGAPIIRGLNSASEIGGVMKWKMNQPDEPNVLVADRVHRAIRTVHVLVGVAHERILHLTDAVVDY